MARTYFSYNSLRTIKRETLERGFHVTSSSPYWWTKTKHLSFASFARPPEIVYFTSVIGVSRGWLKTPYKLSTWRSGDLSAVTTTEVGWKSGCVAVCSQTERNVMIKTQSMLECDWRYFFIVIVLLYYKCTLLQDSPVASNVRPSFSLVALVHLHPTHNTRTEVHQAFLS